MTHFFVPYSGSKPASVSINGHRLIILGQDRDSIEGSLDAIGADRVREFTIGDTREEQEVAFNQIAKAIQGGVIIAPMDVEVEELLKNLEGQLPWIQ